MKPRHAERRFSRSARPRAIQTRRALERALASYVDPQVVRHILSGGAAPLPSGVRRVVTCLFADIRGFTRFTSDASASSVVALLDRFFGLACEVALRHGGTIDKLIGDAVMILFGVPEAAVDDARRALAAGMAIAEQFDAAIAGVRRRGVRLGLGVGIATGPVVLANVGSAVRMDYTVVGATVNLAARLCAEARAREVIYDHATMLAGPAREGVSIRPAVRPLRLKGVPGVVRAHVVRVAPARETTPSTDDVDPVCRMKVATASPYVRHYRGRVHRFCSPGCRARFGRTPGAFRVSP